jgi:hypothetical protein
MTTRLENCTGCLYGFECQAPDNCTKAPCDMNAHTCRVQPIQSGFEYYTCAFRGPTTATTGDSLQTDQCANLPKYIMHRYTRAKSLVTQAEMHCSLDPSAKKSRALLRRAQDELEIALLKIVVEGFGRTGLASCVDEVSRQLDQRAARIRDYRTLRDVRGACAGRPFE